jgi:raffinose/stachyose/melibiose transport system permease protein
MAVFKATKKEIAYWALATLLMLFCLVWIYPFLWMVSASMKTSSELFQKGLSLVPDRISFESYYNAWIKGGFSRYFLNSVLTTVGSIAVVLLRCSTCGYILSMYKFKGSRLYLMVLLATFFIPNGTTIIPVAQISTQLGLMGTRSGVVLALSGGGQVTAILLYKGFFDQTPRSLYEAAVIDGASFLKTFFSIMLPMTGPVTATVTILTFMSSWNNLLIPLVFTMGNPGIKTLPVGMMAFSGAYATDWAGMAAAGTMTLIPIVVCYICLQKYFVSGIAGAVKG